MTLAPVRPQPGPPALAKGTLSRQLVLRVTALVALVAIGLTGLTMLATQRILQDQQDQQLTELSGRPPRHDDDGPGGADFGQDGVLYYGTGYIRTTGQAAVWAFVQQGSTRVPLSASTVVELAKLTGPRFVTVRLEGLGPYRLYANVDPVDGSKTVVGLPATLISGPLVRLALSALALIVVALLLAFFVTRTVVQRSLRPLQRLASTAHEVSQLELHTGEVEVPVRVREGDSDPRSEVGQVGLAFNHMLDNVEGALSARQASEMKVRQFVADASHELRNPLASIRGYAELTRRERDTVSPTLSHALVRIESESDRMSRLVEDLLLLARLDSGPALDLKPLDLTEVILNAVSDARVAGTDHEWTLRVPDEPVMARADRYRLHQVVANLLANARTHTPAGSRVGASLVTDGDWAVISITDNGPGIPETLLPHVFERFTRADASRVRQDGGSSTGLGLAIVAAVVAAHGGHVRATSVPGRTEFSVALPLAR